MTIDARALLEKRLFLSVPQVSEILGLDIEGRTVRKAIEDGEIPATRVGLQWRVPTAWVRQRALLDTTGGDADVA